MPSATSASSRTLITPLTPPGRGAVAVVEVRGPRAVEIVNACFQPAAPPPFESSPTGRIRFGRWRHGGEELVVFRAEPDTVEVHCHGGQAAVELIVESLLHHGAEFSNWPDTLRQRGKPRWQVQAEQALATAVTERASLVLLDQLNGALADALQSIRDAIAASDFPTAVAHAGHLLSTAPLGLHLAQPWRVVLAGPPNVGKSSLINAIVGYERAVVFDQPGTTRDVVQADCAIEGWPVELSDTAGLREGAELLESLGIERTRQQLAIADLVLVVLDARELAAVDDARQLISQLTQGLPRSLVVLNKCDLLAGSSLATAIEPLDDAIPCSAITGKGIPELLDAVSRLLVPEAPAERAAVVFHADQVTRLRQIIAAVESGELTEAAHALDWFFAITPWTLVE